MTLFKDDLKPVVFSYKIETFHEIIALDKVTIRDYTHCQLNKHI